MRVRVPVVMAGASLLVLASSVAAHAEQAAASSTPAAAPAEQAMLGEIVVTARRRSESLQEVPQVVNAVTADTLQKLNIQQFQDIQTVVPGLTLAQGSTGYNSEASLRGVTFTVNTGAQPTVAMYMNDAPVQANFLFQSLFDVGQIEVLRGPQGTTRGISAPSGAITLTTRKPNLSDFGGYADVSLTDLQGRNVQGALNLPVIKDVLGVRVAGLLNQSDYDGVRSLHNATRPREVTDAARVSVSFEPNDRFNANIAYQHLDRNLHSYSQVIGGGNDNAINPPLTFEDRAAVQDGVRHVRQHTDVVTAQLDSRLFGQHLSYVGSYQKFKLNVAGPQDAGNVLPGVDVFQTNLNTQTQTTQEIRLASDPAPGRFFDYTVGAFYNWQENGGTVQQTGTFLPGAFGLPPTFDPAQMNLRYSVPVNVSIPGSYQETSLFGSVTLHLGDKTELSGGVRHIWSVSSSSANLRTLDGFAAVPGLTNCSGSLVPSVYPNTCDFRIRGATLQNLSHHSSATPNIYTISLSHHVTRDLLVYANTGTSFRAGPTAIGVNNGENLPQLNQFIFLQPETSRSYEVGFKSTFLDGRARVNMALWRQRYHNMIVFAPNVPYLSNSSSDPTRRTVSTFGFSANAGEAVVSGVDLESAFQITRDWNVSLQYSYAHGNIEQSSSVPCNDANFDGVADSGRLSSPSQFPAGTVIALCPGGVVSHNPVWNASIQTEYTHPVTEGADGFVRGLVSYYPENRYAEPGFTVSSYALVNLYAGVRSQDGAWELSLYARNAFNNETLLDRSTQFATLGPLAQLFPSRNVTQYVSGVSMTPRREVGVHLRYAWGSR